MDINSLVAQLPFESLSVSSEALAPVHADPDLLAAALMNLLDNAQKQGASRVHVQALLEGDGHVCIRVSDDGPGIPADERQRLQAAMDGEDYDGKTGLGLMLADLVARAHGGRCRL